MTTINARITTSKLSILTATLFSVTYTYNTLNVHVTYMEQQSVAEDLHNLEIPLSGRGEVLATFVAAKNLEADKGRVAGAD